MCGEGVQGMAGVHAVCARMVNYRVWGYRCGGADVGVVGWRDAGVGGGIMEGCRYGGGKYGGMQLWGKCRLVQVWRGVSVDGKCGGMQVWGCRCGKWKYGGVDVWMGECGGMQVWGCRCGR